MTQPALLVVCFTSFTVFAAPVPHDSRLEEALFAGGARDQHELDRLVTKYHRAIDPIVSVVRDQPPAIAAQLLLKHLHMSYGGTTAVLKEYQRASFSLNEALDTGRYNCLSASLLFSLAARDAGLTVTGELYETHARAVVMIDGHAHQVEATSAYGFYADDWFWGGSYASVVAARAQRAQDWFLTTRMDPSTGALTVAASSPLVVADDVLVTASWLSAGQPRDARWASHVAVSTPMLTAGASGLKLADP